MVIRGARLGFRAPARLHAFCLPKLERQRSKSSDKGWLAVTSALRSHGGRVPVSATSVGVTSPRIVDAAAIEEGHEMWVSGGGQGIRGWHGAHRILAGDRARGEKEKQREGVKVRDDRWGLLGSHISVTSERGKRDSLSFSCTSGQSGGLHTWALCARGEGRGSKAARPHARVKRRGQSRLG